ncbi:sigma E protease regulator RseP [Colwellia sp. 1_MG-2023]|uniref:sigma E protease regulator RseP n=1 Tax=Colwellia sp. 1_MG-2023 TaxID=3062649 RepID=UPI0026E1A8DE|nr:sigma E protease regulator RseP [Colwellia sp. 1_MG-2023]MDO6446481.1 sigma E protease regulator RseP [Colwellia sp. 1_MG-2023]
MIDFIWNLSSFVIALGILITVHEYGHFWVARRNKVKVERFSIGFGKAIWRRTDKHGTEFVVALIPLGGYVKMLDERVDDVADEDKDKTFNCKTVYQRIAIVAAGPLANFIFAIFAFYLMFLLGMPSVKPIVGEVAPQSIAANANLPENSEIIEIAGQSTRDWQDVNLALVANIGEPSLVIKTVNKGSVSAISYQLDTREWQFSPEKTSAIESIGLTPFRPKVHNEIVVIAKDSPAERAGLKVGDKPVSVNGVLVNNQWQKFSEQIKQFPNQEVVIDVERDGRINTLTAIPDSIERNEQVVGYLGLASKSDPYPKEYQFELSYGPLEAFSQSLDKTWQLITLSFQMIGKLITGDVSVKNLSGPISIAQGAGDHAGYGLVYFLGFLALISINLGIINLLPVPVLDGGHLVYYFIELFTGRPVPEKIQEIGFKFGTLALLGLMSIALFNDLSRL